MDEEVEIPKSWVKVALVEVCEKAAIVKRKEVDGSGELLYLDIGGVDNKINKIVSHKEYFWKDAPSRAQQIVFQNDILFSTVRTYLKNIAFVENKIYNGQIASSGFTVIRANTYLAVPKYLFCISISQSFLQPLNALQTGTSYPAVRDNDVFGQIVPLPPLAEQHRIVTKIEELFSSLDKAIESITTAKEQLKVYRQAVLKWAFEGKLTNENVIDGELPKGWESLPLGTITIKAKKVKLKEQLPDAEFIYLDIGAIDNSNNKIVSHKTYKWIDAPSRAQQIIKTNDTLFSTVRTYLKNIAYVEKDIYDNQIGSSGFCVIRANIDKVVPKYLFFYTLYQGFITPLNKLQTGTSYPAVRDEDIFSQSINYPKSIAEQLLVVSEIESRLSVCDKIEEGIENSLLKAEALRQSILKRAFEGKLVPQDPNDEPAWKLIERIKAEREKNIKGKKNAKVRV